MLAIMAIPKVKELTMKRWKQIRIRISITTLITLIPFIGMYGCFYATGITWLLNGTFSVIRYKMGKWKTIKLINKKD